MNGKRAALLACVLLAVYCTRRATGAEGAGVVTGIVIDEAAQPVEGAKVRAEPVDPQASQRAIRYVETDSQGRFRMDRLAWDTYRLYAMQEEDGYPNTALALYDDTRVNRFHVSVAAPAAFLVVTIGPKAATVTFTVLDASTGRAIPTSAVPAVKLWRWDDENAYVSGYYATEPVLIPADVAVGLEVHARGYRTEGYAGDGMGPDPQKRAALRMKSGTSREFTFKLQPVEE